MLDKTAPVTLKPSQRFSRAARAEQGRLERKQSQLRKRREALQEKLDVLDAELEALDRQRARLHDLAEMGSNDLEIRRVNSSRTDGGLKLLTGSEIRQLAVPVLIRNHGSGPIHYKDWYTLFNKAGYAAAGKRPDAVFLNQVARSPLVRSTTKSGVYVLDVSAVDQLKEQLRELQLELTELMAVVPEDNGALEDRRKRQRQLNISIGRTERYLAEANQAIEAAEKPMAVVSEEPSHAEAA